MTEPDSYTTEWVWEFKERIRSMRYYQKRFFTTKSRESLVESKRLEKIIDHELSNKLEL